MRLPRNSAVTITYVGAKGEPVTCQCGATFCDIPGLPGRRRKFCSKACSDYAGKGPGRTQQSRKKALPMPLPPPAQVLTEANPSYVLSRGQDRDFPPAWWQYRPARTPDHPVFAEWVLGAGDYPNPDEGQTCRRAGPVIGSDRPWHAA